MLILWQAITETFVCALHYTRLRKLSAGDLYESAVFGSALIAQYG